MTDRLEYRIGKHRVWMTPKHASLWNGSNAFRPSDYVGAVMHLGGYDVPFDAALRSWKLLDEIADEEAVPLTSDPPAL
jgi:hypothetical protein